MEWRPAESTNHGPPISAEHRAISYGTVSRGWLQYADSSRTMNLRETKYLNKYGERAFSHVGPKLWNLLPKNMREEHDTEVFKKTLKSFLMVRGEEFLTWIKRR